MLYNDERQSELIYSYYSLQQGCFFDSIIYEKDYIATKSIIPSPIFNHVFIKKSTLLLDISLKHHAIYLLEKDVDTITLLDLKYTLFDTELWFYHNISSCNNILTTQIDAKKVTNEKEINIFCNIIDDCFEIEQYGVTIKRQFFATEKKKFEHWLFSQNGVLIGAGSYYYDDRCYNLHNISVAKNFRGMGFGKKIVRYLTEKCLVNSDATLPIILQCEANYKHFYEKCGYKLLLIRKGYLNEKKENY